MFDENEELFILKDLHGALDTIRRSALLTFTMAYGGGIPKGLKQEDFFNPKIFTPQQLDKKIPVYQVEYELKCNLKMEDGCYIGTKKEIENINTNLAMYIFTIECNQLVDEGVLDMIFDEKSNSIAYKLKELKKPIKKRKKNGSKNKKRI